MGSYLNNTYLIKAYSAYPYDLEETVENLNYAASFDPDDARSHLLRGVICIRNFGDYYSAIEHFNEAIVCDHQLSFAYNNLAEAYRMTGQFAEAMRVIEFAIKLPDCNKPLLYFIAGGILEKQDQLKLAKSFLNEAHINAESWELKSVISEAKDRIKAKIKQAAKRQKRLKKSAK